jgi:hypothetical protein
MQRANIVLSGVLLFAASSWVISTSRMWAQDRDWSSPENLPNSPSGAPGFPSRAADLDVLPGFQNPPAGYGEVPFWWWTGDPLDKDRLLWQIEQLHRQGVAGMQIRTRPAGRRIPPSRRSSPTTGGGYGNGPSASAVSGIWGWA